MNGVILAAINLVGVLLCAALLAHAIVRYHGQRSGFAFVAIALVLWGLIWLVPQAISAFAFDAPRTLDPLWFANWLISAAAAVLLPRSAASVPRQLHDRAQLDGLGALGVFRYITWPFVKTGIAATAVLTGMATWMEFAQPLIGTWNDSSIFRTIAADPRDPASFGMLAGVSVVLSLPAIALAFFAARPAADAGTMANADR